MQQALAALPGQVDAHSFRVCHTLQCVVCGPAFVGANYNLRAEGLRRKDLGTGPTVPVELGLEAWG